MEKALVTVNGGALTEKEVVSEAIAFAQTGFGGTPVTLPKGYDISRAVKNFCFALPNVKNIEKATKESIYKSVHEYVTRGLDVGKHQCALIVRLDKDENKHYTGTGQLTVQNEYFGNVAQVKRFRADVKDISEGTVIYSGEKVSLYTDEQGHQHIKHEQDFGCWDIGKIAGAYAVVTYVDGKTHAEIMHIDDIKKSWAQSSNGDTVHKAFPAEMCKKTVLNRLCKKLLNKSDDSAVVEELSEQESAYEKMPVIDIGSVEDYAEPSPQESIMPEPQVVALPNAETPPEPQGNPDDEDYCITVPYAKYKDEYAGCATGNYVKSTKTIEVYPNRKKGGKE